jgi:hypothetical protein
MRCPTQQEQCKQINACHQYQRHDSPFQETGIPPIQTMLTERDGLSESHHRMRQPDRIAQPMVEQPCRKQRQVQIESNA